MAKKNTRERVYISGEDQYLFGQGTHYEIYKKLGAHLSVEDGVEGTHFAVWAPGATNVYVMGSFNYWNETQYPMNKLGDGGIYSLFIPGVKEGDMYKFVIDTWYANRIQKADPFANKAELRPGTASIVTDITGYEWSDSEWMEERDKKDPNKQPMAIYECHIGSWMKHPGQEPGFYNYREFADRLVEYLKEMRYTHVELMGIAEYPFDGSWGYQVTGYYAPTSRYGDPKDFMYLVDSLHKIGVGVILDWVPAHFAKDWHGLAEFDGTCIYEHMDSRKGEHPEWGTKIFNYGKTEVKSFLIGNVFYWLREYHVDGIRVDAVASMLYLDYGRKAGEWVPNMYGGNKNLEAIEFFKHLNSIIHKEYPGVVTIAEESTAWPKITGDVNDDGLGFSFKWNMGWMHDFCEYIKLDPIYRSYNHYALTFAMSYNSAENYVLPLSHDEVVHLKCSMLNKIPGYEFDKFANLRGGYAYFFGHAGKKLLFMGQDFAQSREWSEERELDWWLLGEVYHKGMHEYVKELLNIYNDYPAMYTVDNDWAGFEWMNADDSGRSTYSFARKSPDGKRNVLFVINMTPMYWNDYTLGVSENTEYRLILNSDDTRFAGGGRQVADKVQAYKPEWQQNGRDYAITFDLPPFTALTFEYDNV